MRVAFEMQQPCRLIDVSSVVGVHGSRLCSVEFWNLNRLKKLEDGTSLTLFPVCKNHGLLDLGISFQSLFW